MYILFFIFLLAFALVFGVVIKQSGSSKILSFPFWINVSYLFVVLFYFFSPYTYPQNCLFAVCYLLFVCTLLILGYYAGYNSNLENIKTKIRIDVRLCAILSLLGALIYVYDILMHNNVVFGLRIEDQTVTTVGVIAKALSGLGLVSWSYFLIRYITYGGKLSLFAYLSILSFVIPSAITAGRQLFILVAISSLISSIWAIHRRKELGETHRVKRKFPFLLIVIAIASAVYFSFISNVRTQINDVRDKAALFERDGAYINPQFMAFCEKTDAGHFLVEFGYYYSHELPRLEILLEDYHYPPDLGTSMFLYITRRFPFLEYLPEQSEKNVEKCLEKDNHFSSHTWGTIFCNFIVSYGRIGSVFISFIFGFLVGFLFKRKVAEDQTMFYSLLIRKILLCTGAVFSIQYSPTAELNWFFPILLISFWGIVDNSKFSKNNIKDIRNKIVS